MYSCIIYFVALYISISRCVSCTVFVEAPCPIVKPVADINWERYKGLWFEVGRYPDDWQNDGDCTSIEYYNNNGNYFFNLTYVIDKQRIAINGGIEVKSAKVVHKSPKITVSESETETQLPITVIALDYAQYAVAYECIYDEKKKLRQDFLWIATRSHNPEDDILMKIDEVLNKTSYIDKSKIIYDHLTAEKCLI